MFYFQDNTSFQKRIFYLVLPEIHVYAWEGDEVLSDLKQMRRSRIVENLSSHRDLHIMQVDAKPIKKG